MFRHKHNLQRFNYLKTGLFVALLASSFLSDRQYFFYPPMFKPVWNNPFVDIIGIVAGVGLFFYGVFNLKSNKLIGLLLGVCSGFFAFLLTAEIVHLFGVNYTQFKPLIIIEVYMVINIMQVAYEHNPNDK